jgi:hypothetical protein
MRKGVRSQKSEVRRRIWTWIARLAIVAGFAYGSHFFWLPTNQSIMSEGNPASVEHRRIDDSKPIMVRSVLPNGRDVWKKFDMGYDGVPMREFIKQMYAQTFGPSVGFAETQSSSSVRILQEGRSGLPHYVHVVARHPDGTIFYDHTFSNLRTNAGATWQEGQMAGTTAAVCTYIALSNSAITPNATDTSLAGEITTNGLARTLGTVSYTAGASSYTVSNKFTATATQAAQAAALLNAASGGTECFENTFTQVSLNANDTVTVTWTINF